MPRSSRPSRLRRALTAVGLGVVVLYGALPPLSRTAAVRRALETTISERSGLQVRFATIGLGYDLSLFAGELSVGATEREPFLTVAEIEFRPTLWRLWRRRLGDLRLGSPHLYLHRMETGGGGSGSGGAGGRAPRSVLALVGIEVRDAFLHHDAGGREVSVGPATLSLDSVANGDSLELSGGSRLDGAELRWSATLGAQTGFFVARVQTRIADLRDLVRPLAGRELPPAMATNSAEASLTLQGELQGRIAGTLEAEVRRPAFPEIVTVDGNLEARLSPRSASAEVFIAIDPDIPAAKIVAGLAADDTGSDRWTVNLEARDLPLDRLRAWAPDSDLSLAGTLDAQAEATGRRGDARGRGLIGVRGARASGAQWAVAADLAVPVALQGGTLAIEDPGVRATDVEGRFSEFSWKAGSVTMEGNVAGVLEGEPQADLRVAVSDLAAHDADFRRAAQGVGARGAVAVKLRGAGAIEAQGKLSSRGGELLWERFYVNLKNRPASVGGSVRRAGSRLDFERVELAVDAVGRVGAGGSYDLAGGAHSLRAQLEVGDLAQLFAVAVREPFQESVPALGGVQVGGRLRARATAVGGGSQAQRVEAEIAVENASIDAAGPAIRVRDLDVDLPLVLAEATFSAPPRSGRIAIGALDLGGIDVPATEIGLSVRPNRVSLAAPLEVRLLGGKLGIERFGVARSNGGVPEVNLDLSLERLDLRRLTRAMGWPALAGAISGRIPDVRLVESAIRSDAEIRVQVFGGEVRIRDLRLDEVFSPVPALALDVDFENVSLGDLTEAFDVGHVSGIASGAAKNLVLVDGQPVSFEAWIETVEQAGVDQRISVTAVRQLSILGGSGGDPLTQGILSFFDDYRYARMGFRARLENDRFYLRGVESEDGKEYLVVGSTLPPRVNVVSHSQVISFSEMVRRLARAFEDRGEAKINGD